jgi:2'-5' RNA ligase
MSFKPSTLDTHRLFICLLPDAPTRQVIHGLRSAWHWPANRWWTEPARLHATVADPLYFSRDEALRLRQGLQSLHFGSFALRLHRAAVHGDNLALQAAPCPAFRALQGQVRRLAGLAQAPFERLPSPHVTLSRHARGLPSPTLPTAIDWPVSAVCLVWSQLAADVGCRHYEVLARYPCAPEVIAPAQLAFGF